MDLMEISIQMMVAAEAKKGSYLKSNIYHNKGGAVTPPGKEIYGYNRIALSESEE